MKIASLRPLKLVAVLAACAFLGTSCSLPAFIYSPCALSTLTVTKTDDTNDGVCSVEDCSLREAVIASNTCKGTQTIQIPAGTYKLTLAGATEETSEFGDLDITDSVQIQGQPKTILDGNATDRIFDVKSEVNVFISGLVIQNGQTTMFGSAIANQGNLHLDHVTLQNNRQTDPKGSGGTVFSYDPGSSLEVYDSAVINNSAVVDSGGLTNVAGNMTVENVTISGNQGYAVSNLGGQTIIKFSTLADDKADYEIYNPLNGLSVDVSNSILSGRTKTGNCLQPVSSGGFNLDSAPNGTINTCGFKGENDLVGSDPLLQPLADNGGSSFTRALAPNSPAVNSANISTCSTTDQRDVSRPQGSDCDRGAYELENPPPKPTATREPTHTPLPLATPLPPPAQSGNASGASLSFLSAGNCRAGPGLAYKVVTSFPIGKSVVITAYNLDKTWVRVKIPASGMICWASAALGQLSGSISDLPIVEPPPLPDRPTSFTDSTSCSSGQRTVTLSWAMDPNATGYNLYRKDKLLVSLPAWTVSYDDHPPFTNDYNYSIEAFNDYGVSERITNIALACK